MLGIESPSKPNWNYLVPQAHSWKRQLYVKGRKLAAASVWSSMLVNKMTPEEAADDWDLPIEAISEILAYCQENRQFLEMEADEEKRILEEKGIELESKAAR